MKKAIVLVNIALLLALSASGSAMASIVFEDNFNSDGVIDGEWQDNDFGLYIRNFGTDDYTNPANDGFINWVVKSGTTVDLYSEGATNPTKLTLDDSGQGKYVDLAGSGADRTKLLGEITSSSITITQPGPYELSYQIAGNNRNTNPDDVTVTVGVGSLLSRTIDNSEVPSTAGFLDFFDIFNIDAAGDVQITFTAGATEKKDAAGFFLDNVKLRLVPIPGAAILFSSGLVGLICIRRRVR